jgi:hypothetical protein
MMSNDAKLLWMVLFLLVSHFSACAGGWALTHVVWR